MRDRFDEVLRDHWPPGAGEGELPAPPLGAFARGSGAMPGDAATPDAGQAAADGPILGLAPGARWDTKRWPPERFAALVGDFRRRTAAAIRVFLGPREAGWFPGSALAAALDRLAGVEIVREQPLAAVARGLAGCAVTLTNDSGLLHLSEAVGTPVVALFGPTVRAFGYVPTLTASRLLEIELGCRPCSRNGRRPCWRGDLACLTGLETGHVLAAVMAAADWPPAAPASVEAPA
jgi:heptosyltransferase-2